MFFRRAIHLAGAVLSMVPTAAYAERLAPTPATQTFLTNHPGVRAVAHGERLTALYGPTIASDANPATDTDGFVTSFVQDNRSAFGVDNCTLELVGKVDIRNDSLRVYTYRQLIEGLPVEGSSVKIPVSLGATERIGYLGIQLVDEPVAPLPADVLTESAATNLVSQSANFANLTNFGPLIKVIYKAGDSTLHRAWRFYGWSDSGSWLFFVDTGTPEILDAIASRESVDVAGTVSGFGTPGTTSDRPENPPQPMLLPGVSISVLSGVTPPCPSLDGTILVDSSTRSNGAYGPFATPVDFRVASELTGDWVTVKNCAGIHDEDRCPIFNLVGLLNGFTQCQEVQNGGGSLVVDLNLNSPPQEIGTAAMNCYLTANRTHDWFKILQPRFQGIDRRISCLVNATEDGAFYYNNFEVLVFGPSNPLCEDGRGCHDWAFSTIISHEYGHFILDQLVPVAVQPEAFIVNRRFREGTADAVSNLVWDTSVSGDHLFMTGTPSFVRDTDHDVRLDDPSSLPPWCSVDDDVFGHCSGMALPGAFWDLRRELLYCAVPCQTDADCSAFAGTVCKNGACEVSCVSNAECTGGRTCILGSCQQTCTGDGDCPGERCISGTCRRHCLVDEECSVVATNGEQCSDRAVERLFADFLFITDALLDQSVLIEVLAADDDNGNLADGTPNEDRIITRE